MKETCNNMWGRNGVKKFIRLLESKKINSKQISQIYDITARDVRVYIKYVRMNSIHFMGHKKYLVADNKGYYITQDIKIIKKYLNKLSKTGQEMLLQVHQGWKVTSKISRDDNLIKIGGGND